jgi:CBS domain-containing protein
VRVEHVYRPDVPACNVSDQLQQVAQQMSRHCVGALAVQGGGRLVGVISERDMVDAIAAGADVRAATAGDHTSFDVHVCATDEESTMVAHRMLDAGLRHMPVVRDGRAVGLVAMRDLLAVEVWA